jgi:hypothetical protein
MVKLKEFDIYQNEFLNGKSGEMIPILLRKHCGYTFLRYFNKEYGTVNDVYTELDRMFGQNTTIKVYTSNNFTQNYYLTRSDKIFNKLVHEKKYKDIIKPIYPIERLEKVVYLLYFDDGHTHTH